MSENFKRITGSKGFFISDNGEVFRKKQNYEFKRIAASVNNVTGYMHVGIQMKDGSWRGYTVHKLVADAFLKKPRWVRNLEIAHLDNCKQNNASSNLCWMTRKENMLHGWATGQFKKVAKAVSAKRKSLNGNRSELTDTDVRQIRHLRNEGLTNQEVGFIFDLHPMQISRIFNRRSFANV